MSPSDRGPLSLAEPGLLPVLTNSDTMCVWEFIRRAGIKGASVEQIVRSTAFPTVKVQRAIDDLCGVGLLELRPAGRGRRTVTFRTTVKEILVTMDGLNSAEVTKIRETIDQHLVSSFDALFLRRLPFGHSTKLPRRCVSGFSRLTKEEIAEILALMLRIDTIHGFAIRRERELGGKGADFNGHDMALLMRLEPLGSVPLPGPCIRLVSKKPAAEATHRSRSLSDRERQVANALILGRSRPETAKRLGLSPHTVNTLTRRVYAKLGVKSRAELARALVD